MREEGGEREGKREGRREEKGKEEGKKKRNGNDFKEITYTVIAAGKIRIYRVNKAARDS